MSKHQNPKASAVEQTNGACVVLYGLDENDKPRAARFSDVRQRELLQQAANAMTLKLCEAATPELAEVAAKLPTGRLYSNGRGFVPNVRRSLYDRLIEATGDKGPPCLPASLPANWDDIGVGHLVIAHESAAEGWWEAIVVEKNGDMLTLRWRDFPKYPSFVQHRTAVTLLHPVIA